MAIQWGATSGHMQVGIDVRTDAYDWTTTAVNIYVDYYVRTIAWGANDDQSLAAYINGGLWANFAYHINSASGATTQLFVGTVTIGGQGLSYGGGPGYTFQGNVSGSALGANPSHAISYSLPARPPYYPNPPVGHSVTAIGSDRATFWWTSGGDNGSSIGNWELQIATDPGFTALVYDQYTGSVTVVGFVRATTYYWRVRALNGVGWGGWSNGPAFTTLATVPGVPTGLAHGLEGPDSVPLSWAAPAETGGAASTGYDVQAAVAGTGFASPTTVTVPAGTLAYTFGGLTPGVSYDFRVRAGNTVGVGGWSATTTATTLATNRVKVPGVGFVPVRAWGKIPVQGWKPLTVWKRPAGTGGNYVT